MLDLIFHTLFLELLLAGTLHVKLFIDIGIFTAQCCILSKIHALSFIVCFISIILYLFYTVLLFLCVDWVCHVVFLYTFHVTKFPLLFYLSLNLIVICLYLTWFLFFYKVPGRGRGYLLLRWPCAVWRSAVRTLTFCFIEYFWTPCTFVHYA